MLDYMMYSILEDVLVVLVLIALYKFNPELSSSVRLAVRRFLRIETDAARDHLTRKTMDRLNEDLDDLSERYNQLYTKVDDLEHFKDGTVDQMDGFDIRLTLLEDKQKEAIKGVETVVSSILSLEESLYRRLGPTPKVRTDKILKVIKITKGKKK